jgi:hypothetical protein
MARSRFEMHRTQWDGLERGVTEVGCLAHARRKFHDLWVNHQSAVAQ